MPTNMCLTKLLDTSSIIHSIIYSIIHMATFYLKCSHMNDRRRATVPFVLHYQAECMPTIPKCMTSIK